MSKGTKPVSLSYATLYDPLPYDGKRDQIRPTERNLNASLAFRLRKFAPLIVDSHQAVAAKDSQDIHDIVPDIQSVSLRPIIKVSLKDRSPTKRNVKRKSKEKRNQDAIDIEDIGGFDDLLPGNEEENTVKVILAVVDQKTEEESDGDVNVNEGEKVDQEDIVSHMVENLAINDNQQQDPNVNQTKPDQQPSPALDPPVAKSDIAEIGDLQLVEADKTDQQDNAAIQPSLPGSQVFYSRACTILREAGPKTRQHEIERERLLKTKGAIFNKYSETRKVLGYGPNLGIQREYQKHSNPKVITVSLRRKKQQPIQDKPDRKVTGFNVIRNSSKQSALPALFPI